MKNGWLLGLALLSASCSFDPAYRNNADAQADICTAGYKRCLGDELQSCASKSWQVVQNCKATGLVCAPSLLTCTTCLPNATVCQGADIVTCDPQGQAWSKVATCDYDAGLVCSAGECLICGQIGTPVCDGGP